MAFDRRCAGFTLTELMVSSAIGLFTLAVAVQMASDHTAVLTQTTQRVDTVQSGRIVADLLAEDLRHAGVGIGYRPDGSFAGLIRGPFTVAGGAQFSADGFAQTLTTGAIRTDDLGIRVATGAPRTIASFSGSLGQICSGSGVGVGDTVVLLSREALHVRTVQLLTMNSGPCLQGVCRTGCTSFTFARDVSYESDTEALTASYIGGEMVGEYAEIVYFVVPGQDGDGELRRAQVTAGQPCAVRDETCGGLVADDVETLQVAVWQWDEQLGAWVDQTQPAAIADRRRLRVDVEVVLRGGQDRQTGAHQPVALKLDATQCVGGNCGAAADAYRRYAIRTSVEIRNGGRMLIR